MRDRTLLSVKLAMIVGALAALTFAPGPIFTPGPMEVLESSGFTKASCVHWGVKPGPVAEMQII